MSTELEIEEQERMRRRKERIQRMKREKQKRLRMQRLIKRLIPLAIIAIVVLVIVIVLIMKGIGALSNSLKKEEKPIDPVVTTVSTGDMVSAGDVSANEIKDEQEAKPVVSTKQYSASETASTCAPPSEVDSSNVIFVDVASGNIIAQKDCHTVVNPASMTKVLTLLVAAEHITNLDDTYTITIDVTDYSFSHQCSNVGFAVGETVTVRDLLYGTILPSGGDAAVGLANYVAGSHEEFVNLMNEKLEILGLSDTAHFTNCVGLYDTEHHCTPYDMAMIMQAALENDLCREVLSAHTYTTSATEQHPDGITVSNWFLRRIEDKDTGGMVSCAKTGYVVQSGNCAVSYGTSENGKEYICVTTGAHSSWKCIYDHVAIYKHFSDL